ncbi:MAG: hypothetical protein JWP74_3839 [Marmoricola sp.]|nr:hypothetical protein [Marmoricola sp.]
MYGQNTTQLRAELGTLMQLTRNEPELGELPKDAVQLLASFRHSITLWCQQAVRASNPTADLGGTTPRSRGPAEEFRFRLAIARAAYTAPLPTLDELATPYENRVVDAWRRAAKAAVLGEHDFPAGLSYVSLTDAQCMTVLKDAAEVARALVGVDRRFTAVPSWEPIIDRALLGRSAVVCAAHSGYTEPDYNIDRRGWRPPVRLSDGPVLPGLGGVLQAENNLLVQLRYQPDGHSLRLILDSQRIVSHHAASLARVAPGVESLAVKWAERSQTYVLLIKQSRNLRGLIGHGNAAIEGAMAASRISSLTLDAAIDARQLWHLDALFDHINRRLAETIAKGADDRSYLMRIGIPRVDLTGGGAVKQQRSRHIPLDVPTRAPLLDTARNRLMPKSAEPQTPTSAPSSCADFNQHSDLHRALTRPDLSL